MENDCETHIEKNYHVDRNDKTCGHYQKNSSIEEDGCAQSVEKAMGPKRIRVILIK